MTTIIGSCYFIVVLHQQTQWIQRFFSEKVTLKFCTQDCGIIQFTSCTWNYSSTRLVYLGLSLNRVKLLSSSLRSSSVLIMNNLELLYHHSIWLWSRLWSWLGIPDCQPKTGIPISLKYSYKFASKATYALSLVEVWRLVTLECVSCIPAKGMLWTTRLKFVDIITLVFHHLHDAVLKDTFSSTYSDTFLFHSY